ncbi:hypothetical protein [Haloarcula litorea]|uniref:hypothetical protein n=1 Tax=Haloarcula litorea TaxID=3032579 RepID=UPI0023E8E7C3|nr:hypothetical protein [Halomicroarcula sp. GDY20]
MSTPAAEFALPDAGPGPGSLSALADPALVARDTEAPARGTEATTATGARSEG